MFFGGTYSMSKVRLIITMFPMQNIIVKTYIKHLNFIGNK